MPKKVVCVYSGGMDSYTLLNWLYSKNFEIHAISFDYGQRNQKELKYAARACYLYGIHHDVFRIHGFYNVSALTSDAQKSMQQTVVPNRNMIMLSVASAYALSIDSEAVYFGANAGDHAIYPDCRLPFVEAFNDTVQLGNDGHVAVHAPFIDLDKTQIARIGMTLGLDYKNAWTCYSGHDKACGKCRACVERKKAIQISGATDNMKYT